MNLLSLTAISGVLLFATMLNAQPFDPPDREQPGDEQIQNYLRQETEKIEGNFLGPIKSVEDWNRMRPKWREEYLQMMGLWPLPEKTPLEATITRTLDRGEYLVDMIHYQSRPGFYVTGHVYRPAKVKPGERLPAISYVCGHTTRGRNGNKTAFQSHGIWFARHGYICLIVDTLQLGEVPGLHHGMYSENRWWWLSRGYTPAGVECWNGIRGLDYLVSRPDVDPERIGVTGISGGGGATFWIAAADERVKAAVPVSGMGDLTSYVSDRVINGHCDCIFLYNTYQWPWTRIAALVAPRPLLFVNSDHDQLFPVPVDERVIARLERVYSLFGAGDKVDSLLSVGGHDYRQDIRQAAYRFMNTHLKNDPRPVLDTEVDLVSEPRLYIHPIAPEIMRVFPEDKDIPKKAINARIDYEFVPMAKVEVPKEGTFDSWKADLLAKLRRMTFHHFPERIPPARKVKNETAKTIRLKTESDLVIRLAEASKPATAPPERIFVFIVSSNLDAAIPDWVKASLTEKDALYLCEPRGLGASRWTQKNPPNYVERSHYLLGRTVDSGRIWDIAATARYLNANPTGQTPVHLMGEGASAVLAIYAALLEPDIAGVILHEPPQTHMENSAPALLNVLRVCDIPDALGMLAPRPVTLMGNQLDWTQKSADVYRIAGVAEKFVVKK